MKITRDGFIPALCCNEYEFCNQYPEQLCTNTFEVIIINVLVPTGIAVSLTTAANWTGNFVVAITTPVLIASQLQTYGTFYIYSLLLAAGLLFALLTLPETKVRSHL